MAVVEWIRFLIGAACILGGMAFYCIQFIGLYRFKYTLTRLHAGAIGDTLGGGLALIGTMILFGLSFATLKLLVIELTLWFTTPVASHMVAKFEVLSRKNIENFVEVKDIDHWREEE